MKRLLQAQLRQALGTKSRLERQMDSLDINDLYYDRKILDLRCRYDEQYGKIEERGTVSDWLYPAGEKFWRHYLPTAVGV